jgi:hypothetical protein
MLDCDRWMLTQSSAGAAVLEVVLELVLELLLVLLLLVLLGLGLELAAM